MDKTKKQTNNQPTNTALYKGLTLVIFLLAGTLVSWLIVHAYTAAVGDAVSFYFEEGNVSHVATAEGIQTTQPARLLDGVLVPSDQTSYWPYAVMIENLLSVRPQSGLSQASVVYETLAEGGATRFMAVFDPSEVMPEIGPVRSSRPYYLEWASEYAALYAHAGGSPKALTVIRENSDLSKQNLEALGRDGVYFWRDHGISAPHNLFTSSEKMNFALRDKGFADQTASFQPWLFKNDAALADRGQDGKTATFNFSYGLTYKVGFQYNRERNVYLRFNADQPHTDKNTGKQIEAKNVIVQLVEEPQLVGEKGRLDIYVGGTGKAWIFRDGQVIPATWKKTERTERTRFYDADDKEIELNSGNTWVQVLSKTQDVTYE